ncbi:response regulator transcription factor [Fodinicurvata sp. EGI_FJ10296]|uniref:response regulator transcription factor n=1 Tax=Fodinicurvata sp. EGI_FJ10296 TaxID=3231908 RepID=UPI003455F2CD
MAQTVLIIDDDTRLTAMLAGYLSDAGYTVHREATATAGLAAADRTAPDAVILDIMLPDGDGFDICRRIRASSDVPIVMLTARGDETDRIVGLEIGADDYLPKPFSPRELLARLRAVMRRRQAGPDSAAPAPLRFGRLEIDRAARTVRVDGQERVLTSHQFDLLVALAQRPGRVLTREHLMDLVRGVEFDAFDRSIDVHISRIRQAVETDPKHPRRIITVRGAGYVFAGLQDEGDQA